MCKDRVANRFGRCFHHKKERFELKNLKPGDHIVEERLLTYWHHMIVENIDLDEKQINVIHYYDKQGPSGSGSVVCHSSFTYTPDKFYRIVYEDKECLPASEVLEKAEPRVVENEPTYCFLTNNCEHFANECKTGEKECHQIWTLIEILGKSAISSIGSLANAAKKSQFMSSVINKLLSVCAKLKKIPIKKLTEEYRAKFSPKLAFYISVLIEVVLLFRDWHDAKAKFSEGKLTRGEFWEVIVRRICALVCSIPGFLSGYLLGGIIPLAFLGGWWALPAVLGAIVVGAGGDYLAKVAGGYLEEIITPLVLSIDKYLQSENMDKYLQSETKKSV